MAFNFKLLTGKGLITDAFAAHSCTDFNQAANFVRYLPYGRNTDKTEPLILFKEGLGTCGTKHAALCRLAEEQEYEEVTLWMGIFKMNRINTPRVVPVLDKYQLPYIPEAHNYLRINGSILDCTWPNASAGNFENDLLEEIRIQPDQIGAYKVSWHMNFLRKWCDDQKLPYTLEEIWNIREKCIAALSG
ncbi:MAG: hypothetical protein WC756_15815 [Taibaiella sp.]|jgi:hypothetical protein